MKKDDYLAKMVMEPPKQRARIHPFDARTQQEAFAVSLDGLKYVCVVIWCPRSLSLSDVILTCRFLGAQWNVNTLILESAQAREDRKKRVRSLIELFHLNVHPQLTNLYLCPLPSL